MIYWMETFQRRHELHHEVSSSRLKAKVSYSNLDA